MREKMKNVMRMVYEIYANIGVSALTLIMTVLLLFTVRATRQEVEWTRREMRNQQVKEKVDDSCKVCGKKKEKHSLEEAIKHGLVVVKK